MERGQAEAHTGERGRKYHSVYGEYFMEEGELSEETTSHQQSPRKSKKSKRWFKKFGSRSVEYASENINSQHRQAGLGKKPASLGEGGEKAIRSPKTRKRWSFGSRVARKREVMRSHSLHFPSGEATDAAELMQRKKNLALRNKPSADLNPTRRSSDL